MSDTKPKRDPLASAPTSQEIMSGARRRTPEQNTSIPASQHTSTKKAEPKASSQVRPKATFYLPAGLQKALKRYAVEREESQSQIVEMAIREYMENHKGKS